MVPDPPERWVPPKAEERALSAEGSEVIKVRTASFWLEDTTATAVGVLVIENNMVDMVLVSRRCRLPLGPGVLCDPCVLGLVREASLF